MYFLFLHTYMMWNRKKRYLFDLNRNKFLKILLYKITHCLDQSAVMQKPPISFLGLHALQYSKHICLRCAVWREFSGRIPCFALTISRKQAAALPVHSYSKQQLGFDIHASLISWDQWELRGRSFLPINCARSAFYSGIESKRMRNKLIHAGQGRQGKHR